MPLVTLAVKHNQTQEAARQHLERAIQDVQGRYGSLLQRVEWAPDRNSVKLYATGVQVDLRVDAQDVHVVADVPGLLGMIASPLLIGLRGAVEKEFQKQLPRS
jgi:hypothetical protein